MGRETYHPPEIESFKIAPEVKGKGVFYDVHEVLKGSGELADKVVKEFHLDLLFSPESAIELFSKQEEEYELMREYFHEDQLPRTVFLTTEEYAPQFERAKLDTDRIYPYHKFWQIQLNRRLQGRYNLDARQQANANRFINRAILQVGKLMEKFSGERETVAVAVQERIHGVSFGQLLKREELSQDPNFETLRQNVARLISGMREMHRREPRAAFTWHSLESDNVIVETDEEGKITGRVAIVDTNFIQRPDEVYKKIVVNKLEKKILQVLEDKFNLKDN